MGKRTVVLVVALLLAAISAFAVWSFLRGVERDVKADVEEVVVFRATERIEAGTDGATAIGFIEESRENAEFLPPTAIQSRESLEETLAGAVLEGPISQGQIVTTDLWVSAAEIETARLSGFIADPGKVAVAIQSGQVEAVGGFVRPGDRINLIASAELSLANFVSLLQNPDARELLLGIREQAPVIPGIEDGGTTEADVFASTLPTSLQFTQTVLQGIEVLAVGPDVREVSPGTGLIPADSTVIVLEVTPDEAEKIVFAQRYAQVHLALVPEDYVPVESDGVIVDDLFSLIDRLLIQLEDVIGR
jgi:pilus assembly protein CpaB